MSKKKEPKYKGKQCISWLDADGQRHRTRFFKGTSVRIIDRKLQSRLANITCFDVEVVSKDAWANRFGKVDPPRKEIRSNTDLKFVPPDYGMKKWKQDNRHLYYGSIF